jgi:hypothetical protein
MNFQNGCHSNRNPNHSHAIMENSQPNQNQQSVSPPMQDDQLAAVNPSLQMRMATDVAGVCREIVTKTAIGIQGKKYIRVEGWEAIATCYGCVAGARDVEKVTGGMRAIGELRRIQDGVLIATAEGFVGEDETTWYGGEKELWDKVERQTVKKQMPKRSDYAIRAMAQTRAISRVCRSAFAHVVVLIDSNLSTTPAEEVPDGGFHDHFQPSDEDITERQVRREKAAAAMKEASTPTEDPVNAALQEASTTRRRKKQ